MKFIELTYYKPEKNYGGGSGKTSKTFLLNVEHISRITSYKDSIKLNLLDGAEIEVCESKKQLILKLKK